jgi:hypothetical protein
MSGAALISIHPSPSIGIVERVGDWRGRPS